ncbi:MAG: hypothetical protein H0T97_06260 [Actinobacteria bacterium]|nr:hypothetical protein [Actinomycetota bacterium]
MYPKISTNSSQWEIRVASFIGPLAESPTNPVIRVSAISSVGRIGSTKAA